MRSRAGPVIEISIFATETSVTRMKIFTYGPENFLDKIASLFATLRPKWRKFCLLISTFEVCELAFLVNEVTIVHKATTAANGISLSSTILISFLEFHPSRPSWNFPYEHTTKLVPVTEPARLPGSYQVALTIAVISELHYIDKKRTKVFWLKTCTEPWNMLGW